MLLGSEEKESQKYFHSANKIKLHALIQQHATRPETLIEEMKYKDRNDGGSDGGVVLVVVEVVMKKGRCRLLDYLMEFLASSCYIERTEEREETRKFGTC